MKKFNTLIILLLITLVGCSSKKSKETTVATDSAVQDADFIVDAENESLIIDESAPIESDSLIVENNNEQVQVSEEMVSSAPIIDMSGEMGSYTVKQGETLMMVAFNIYGDYRKWKDLQQLNGLNSSIVRAGSEIKFNKPMQEFSWSPEGLPHLIKNGETLVTISKDKYGTYKKWKNIYNNNKPLIKDPNLIFAGFTLYYIPERELASEGMME